jgi:hypothetical protein
MATSTSSHSHRTKPKEDGQKAGIKGPPLLTELGLKLPSSSHIEQCGGVAGSKLEVIGGLALVWLVPNARPAHVKSTQGRLFLTAMQHATAVALECSPAHPHSRTLANKKELAAVPECGLSD